MLSKQYMVECDLITNVAKGAITRVSATVKKSIGTDEFLAHTKASQAVFDVIHSVSMDAMDRIARATLRVH